MRVVSRFLEMGLVAAAAMVMACSNNDNGGNNSDDGTPVINSQMKAKADGTVWQSKENSGVATYYVSANKLIITGTDFHNEDEPIIIVMSVENFEGNTGTHQIFYTENDEAYSSAYYSENGGTTPKMWVAPYEQNLNCGEVKITHFSNDRVKGTFKFKGLDPTTISSPNYKNITEGEFDIPVTRY